MIVAEPAATPVTTPVEGSTVAIVLSLDDQVTVLSVVFDGVSAAASVVVDPTATDAVVGVTVIPVTATAAGARVMVGGISEPVMFSFT